VKELKGGVFIIVVVVRDLYGLPDDEVSDFRLLHNSPKVTSSRQAADCSQEQSDDTNELIVFLLLKLACYQVTRHHREHRV
jgi:hypothetical protein